MAKGYQQEHVQQKIIDVLSESKTGLSGVEIAEKLGINRATIAKYLNVFAAEGIIKQKNIGNANLWFLESGTEKFEFPADYYLVKEKFIEYLTGGNQYRAYHLIRNCQHSGADVSKIAVEVMIPAIIALEELYLKAKIGKSEAKLFHEILSNSIQILGLVPYDLDPKRNVVTLAADPASTLYSQTAGCVFSSRGWQVWPLGDASDAIDVLYELDLQKFLTRVWKQKQSLMIIIVFSSKSEGAKFFSESVNSIKPKFGKNLRLGVYSMAKGSNPKADFVSDNFEALLHWVDSLSGSTS